MTELTIDELAAKTRVPSRTIRFYQSQGVLPKPELRGRVAIYGPAHVERLELVAELQERGLQIKAISELLERVDTGELALHEWLGLDDQLKQPWADDAPKLVTAAELKPMIADLRPAELARVGLIEKRGDSWLVPSVARLALAVNLSRAGVELDLVVEASRLLRKRLGKAAEELAELFLARGKKGRVLQELRSSALEATRLIFAQEMERVLREWTDSGRTANLPLPSRAGK